MQASSHTSAKNLSVSGRITYAFAAVMSFFLLFASLISVFVPSVSAVTQLSLNQVPDGDITSYCDDYGAYDLSIDVIDNDFPEDWGNFSADYRVDGGSWQAMDVDSTDFGYVRYYSALDCQTYRDTQSHTIEFRGTTPSGTATSEIFTFNNGPTEPLEFTVLLESQSPGGTVQTLSNVNNYLGIYGSATVNDGYEFNSFENPSTQFRIDGGSYQTTDYSSDNGQATYFGIEWSENEIADGTYDLDILLTESTTNTQETFSYTLIIGESDEPNEPTVYLQPNNDSQFTITDGSTDITGTATFNSGTIQGIGFRVDNGSVVSETSTTAVDGNWDSGSEEFAVYDIASYYEIPNGTYTLTIVVATDQGTFTFDYTMILDIPQTPAAPVISIDQSLTAGEIEFTTEPLTITGDVSVTSDTLESLYFEIDGVVGSTLVTPDDGTADSGNESFTIPLASYDLTEGNYTIRFTATSANEGLITQDIYTLIIDLISSSDTEKPTCGTTWYNQVSPVFANSVTYNNITCTDNEAVDSAFYRIYHVSFGELAYEEITLADSGSFGSTEVEFSFTANMPASPNRDGSVEIELHVFDAAGNMTRYVDPIIIDYADQTAPSLNIQLVQPDPLSFRTPSITGTCSDDNFRETNTNIDYITLQVDGGSSTNLSALDGAYDSRTESFSYMIPELSNGAHTVTVRCYDEAGNMTTEEEAFEIVDPADEVTPGEYSFTETFTDHDNQDLANSTLIWGNGRLRLAEDITVSRSALDTASYRDRYDSGTDYSEYRIIQGLDENQAWYTKNNSIGRLNLTTEEATTINPADFGAAAFNTIFHLAEITHGGSNYLLVGDNRGITVLNLSNNTSVFSDTYLGHTFVLPDTDRSRLGFYTITELAETPGESSRLMYWDMNNTPMDFSDDTVTRMPANASGITGRDVLRIFRGVDENEFYVSVYDEGLFRWNDNNTPTNFGDDQSTEYNNFDVLGITFDRNNNLIYGTASVDNGNLFVVTDDNDTPYDSSDDTIIQLTFPVDLGFNDIYDLAYIQGENGVGDQILVQMENGNPFYVNLNDTYEDLEDDTYIELAVNAGIRPSRVRLLVRDYNTVFANIDRQGLYKVNLLRGWEEEGQAVALPSRPAESLLVNNFFAEATLGTPIAASSEQSSVMAQESNRFIPQAYAQGVNGVTYEVSSNDGVTWEEVTLGELQQLQENDYRLQFRIIMNETGGSSPVVTSYTLGYAGYPEESQQTTVHSLDVSVSPTTVGTNDTFTVTVTANDVLGYRVNTFSGNVQLGLRDTGDNDRTSLLNLTQVSLVDGQGSVTGTRISESGEYRVRASYDSISALSSLMTVTGASNNTPTLTLTANNYSPRSGQGFTLNWTSTNMTQAELNGETVPVNGSKDVSVTQDTDFVIRASGPNGNLASSVFIRVDNEDKHDGENPITTLPIRPIIFTPIDGDESATDSAELLEFTNPEDGEGSESGAGGTSDTSEPVVLEISPNQKLLPGEKAIIWWRADNAQQVLVDYLGGIAANSGSFEIIADESRTVTITAVLGEQRVTRTIEITVVQYPWGLADRLPAPLLPILAATMRYAPASWLSLTLLLKLLLFLKRSAQKEIDVSMITRILHFIQNGLWVVSPLTLIMSVATAQLLGGIGNIAVALLAVIVSLRHLFQWVKTMV